MNRTKGFTLIELLVVIAIIGILSSIVLASLNTARTRGNDAAVKADLKTIQTQASLYFDTNSDYGDDTNDCLAADTLFADPTVALAIAGAETNSGPGNTATCYADDGVAAAGTSASSWAISVPLRSPGQSWCVDSSGAAASGTATLVSDIAVCQ
jgi:prepilin-type N-terminal cleavage/methylation domain-containing protein